jgi:predicted DNA-binding protein
MTITVRLNPDLQKELDLYARREGMTRSEFVRECIREYLVHRKECATAWELGKEIFGKHASGQSDRSTNRKQILREKLHARQNRR